MGGKRALDLGVSGTGRRRTIAEDESEAGWCRQLRDHAPEDFHRAPAPTRGDGFQHQGERNAGALIQEHTATSGQFQVRRHDLDPPTEAQA